MARKQATIVIETGRDKGQKFLITEMPATESSVLSFQVFQLLAEAGVDLDIKSLDVSGIIRALMRVLASLSRQDFEYYREWLFRFIEWQNPSDATKKKPVMLKVDIEDAMTIHRLMFESLKINLEDVFTELKQIFPSLNK